MAPSQAVGEAERASLRDGIAAGEGFPGKLAGQQPLAWDWSDTGPGMVTRGQEGLSFHVL